MRLLWDYTLNSDKKSVDSQQITISSNEISICSCEDICENEALVNNNHCEYSNLNSF